MDFVRVLQLLIAGWRYLLVGSLLGLGLALLYLRLATPEYRISYRITPTQASNNLSDNVSGLSGIAALAGVSIGQSGSGATPFDLYIDRLTSQAMANRLVHDDTIMHTAFYRDWDASAQKWREPSSFMYSAAQFAKSILGYPSQLWRPPSARDLRLYLERKIIVRRPALREPPITTISLDHGDPAFAVRLLDRLDDNADKMIKQEALERATRYSAYLTRRMPSVVIAELRVSMAQALAEQERAIMLVSSDAAYAVLKVAPPSASPRPVSPNYPLIAMVGVLVGLFTGCVAVFYRGSAAA